MRDVLNHLRRPATGPASQQPAMERQSPKPAWFRVPVIASNPAAGLSLGAGFEVMFYSGTRASTRASTVSTSAMLSLQGNVVAVNRLALYSPDNTWFVQGDHRFEISPRPVFGVGMSADPAQNTVGSDRFLKAHDIVYRRVRGPLYAGVGLHYSAHLDIGPSSDGGQHWASSAFMTYSREHGFVPTSQTSAGTSANLLFDSRDSAVNATRGWRMNASYRTYARGFLGGDASWQRFLLDVRAYRALTDTRRHTLAFWTYGDLVTGGAAPYFDLPATAGDPQGRSGRGYVSGRFRGERLVYGEIEYRGTVTPRGLFGVVAFLNLTTVSNSRAGERLFDAVAPGAGVGLRLLLDKVSRTNLCLDVGFGRHGSRGIYIAVQETF